MGKGKRKKKEEKKWSGGIEPLTLSSGDLCLIPWAIVSCRVFTHEI